MRRSVLALALLLAPVASPRAQASVGVGIAVPGISIGINVPAYPELVPVPGYPVYYAPGVPANYFFYDGLYWLYVRDNWYASSWYNGPWRLVPPHRVPLYVLRVPVRYYRAPPPYFHHWHSDRPPRWGKHWGREWERRHAGWDRWNRNGAPPPAPLPHYQREFVGDRYPHEPRHQYQLRAENYRHQPRDAFARQQFRPPPGREHGRERGDEREERRDHR